MTPYNRRVTVALDSPQFKPVALAFKDLWYSVPNPKKKKENLELIKGVSGFATPGTITALMGSSGAGKTTLMDVIAGRKTGGNIRGEILLNGHPATDLAIRRATGYCEQMDIHAEATTFREALAFSAFLRQGSEVSVARKRESVDECLDLLDLRSIADKLVRGSSIEQMKRLTIGVELAAQPSILFLDEPTSGLDARSAKMVMEGIRKVADTGRTVVCTIHQPSADVFSVFDSLLLLKRGGETVFFGELGAKSRELIEYFEAMEGVPRLPLSCNPATWMLDVINASSSKDGGPAVDFAAAFKTSEKKAVLERRLNEEGIGRAAPGSAALSFRSKRAESNWTQFVTLMRRFVDMYARTPEYTVARLVVNIVLALLIGFTFYNAKLLTYQEVNASVGMIFSTTIFIGGISFDSVRPLAMQSRDVFYRERSSQTYSAFWYFIGFSLIEIPYAFGITLFFTSIFFPVVGFRGLEQFLLYWFYMSTFVLTQTYFGQLIAFVSPSLEVSSTFSILLLTIFFLFGGFNPPASQIPDTHKWMYYITPQTHATSSLATLMLGECESPSDLGCRVMEGIPPTLPQGLTIKQYLELVFDMKREDMWSHFGLLLAIMIVLRIAALLALRYINHQKR